MFCCSCQQRLSWLSLDWADITQNSVQQRNIRLISVKTTFIDSRKTWEGGRLVASGTRVHWQCTHLISEIIMRNVKYEIPCHHITTLIIIIIMQAADRGPPSSNILRLFTVYSTGCRSKPELRQSCEGVGGNTLYGVTVTNQVKVKPNWRNSCTWLTICGICGTYYTSLPLHSLLILRERLEKYFARFYLDLAGWLNKIFWYLDNK